MKGKKKMPMKDMPKKIPSKEMQGGMVMSEAEMKKMMKKMMGKKC